MVFIHTLTWHIQCSLGKDVWLHHQTMEWNSIENLQSTAPRDFTFRLAISWSPGPILGWDVVCNPMDQVFCFEFMWTKTSVQTQMPSLLRDTMIKKSMKSSPCPPTPCWLLLQLWSSNRTQNLKENLIPKLPRSNFPSVVIEIPQTVCLKLAYFVLLLQRCSVESHLHPKP